ncbi:MAG: NAD(P)-dependent oxidoreductase [Oscillospiraceae bacterium]
MKTAILTNNVNDAKVVFGADFKEAMRDFGLLEKTITKSDLEKNPDLLKDAEYVFTTWGMPHFTNDEIKKFFPNLKAVLYAAGSVQSFAKEFLDEGISVHSAWKANAIPVAEFAFSQIVLASKGYFGSVKKAKHNRYGGFKFSNECTGNYKSKIGIIGAGGIGSLICEKLKHIDCEVLVYDKFLSKERADELNVSLTSLEEIFKQCDVISNHLANKEELYGVLNYDLFKLMKSHAVFINTGRGKQVKEKDLVKAMREVSSRTALLDVTSPEPPIILSPIRHTKNIILSPHIAGSTGKERERMSAFMLDEFNLLIEGKPPIYSVTKEMLKTMA